VGAERLLKFWKAPEILKDATETSEVFKELPDSCDDFFIFIDKLNHQ